ncbi:Crp/Fnr family transcriptional regulator, partial [Thermodesulfobacteriota bacterium]
SSIPLFKGLPEEQHRDLAMIVVDSIMSRGKSIFSEGDEGTGFYVVLSGRVKIYKLSSEGREQILHIFGEGEVFGEVPVFAGQNFPANAEAMEESRIFYFPRDSLIELMRKNPSIAMNMLAVLSMRLRRFTLLIDDLSLKEVPGRLAAHLLYLSEQGEGSTDLELNITKGQLASLLGTIPETLSRILSKMTGQGLIESDGPRIRILDRDGLVDLADFGGKL